MSCHQSKPSQSTCLTLSVPQAVRRLAPESQQFASLQQATLLQVVCGAVLPLLHHWWADRGLRQKWRRLEAEERRQMRAPEEEAGLAALAPWLLHQD